MTNDKDAEILLMKELIKQIEITVNRFESKATSCDASGIMTLFKESLDFIRQTEHIIADIKMIHPGNKEILDMDRHFNAIKDRFVRASLEFENDCTCTKKITKGKEYIKYEKAISGYIDNIRKEIRRSSTGYIKIRLHDIKRLMGPEFEKRSDIVVYSMLKRVLFEKGIVAYIGRDEHGIYLTMRFSTIEEIAYGSV